jgi:hypothetical protein
MKDKKDDILDKDCPDFIPLEDGTIHGEKKYCNLSLQCRQANMKSDYVQFFDPKTGKLIGHDYFCTGKKPIFEERMIDEEAK